MNALELLWFVYEWLPLLFLLDVVVYHLVGDDPVVARSCLGRRSRDQAVRLQ